MAPRTTKTIKMKNITMNITGSIITLNEEKLIAKCIKSLQKVCNEIIVVDSNSTDRTVEIAKEMGAKVIQQDFLGDGPQKAFGVQFATNDWILSLDADERLDDDAVAAIEEINLIKTDVAYALKRKNFLGDHWMKSRVFYPDYVTRLYNKNSATYSDSKYHATVNATKIEKLNANIIHFTYKNYEDWTARINSLTSYDAWALKDKGKQPSKSAPLVHALIAGFRCFILKGGLFQGRDGIDAGMTTMFRTYLKYAKLNELYQ